MARAIWLNHAGQSRRRGRFGAGRACLGGAQTFCQGRQRPSASPAASSGRSRAYDLLLPSLPRSTLGIVSDEVSLSLALLFGVLMLVAWGVLFARREGHGPAAVLIAALLNGCVGLFIVVLKAALP